MKKNKILMFVCAMAISLISAISLYACSDTHAAKNDNPATNSSPADNERTAPADESVPPDTPAPLPAPMPEKRPAPHRPHNPQRPRTPSPHKKNPRNREPIRRNDSRLICTDKFRNIIQFSFFKPRAATRGLKNMPSRSFLTELAFG